LDQGIVAIFVVSATDPRFLEAGRGVQPPGGPVGGGHLQGGVSGSSGPAVGQQPRQHPATKPVAPEGRIHGHHGDVQFIEDQPATGHGPQFGLLPDPETRPVRFGQLTLPLLLAPQAPQGPPVEIQAVRQIRMPQRPQQAQLRLRACFGIQVGRGREDPYDCDSILRSGVEPLAADPRSPSAMVSTSALDSTPAGFAGGEAPLAAGPAAAPFEADVDAASPNRNLAPITTALDQKGSLVVGGCRLEDLARTYGTPLYVLDEATLRATCRAYSQALETFYPGPSLALYASKANSSLALTALVASEGLGLDAVSAGELLTALQGGMPPDRIVLHGNNKSEEELELALAHHVTVVVDNWQDVEILSRIAPGRQSPVRLLVRFTPGIECHTHEYIRTGHLDSKFGFDPDQLEPVLRHLAGCRWAWLDGLHAHIGSQIFELDPHRDLAGVMADALALARSLGHPCSDLNVGGGLGIRYVASDDPPTIEAWVRTVAEAVATACRERGLSLPRLLCEPGRSLVATAGITLYTVGSRKEIPGIRTYVSIDGGMSDNPRPITYQSRYTAVLAAQPLAAADGSFTVAGKHCESGDVLLPDIALPQPATGAVLAVFATGAYNASMGSNYNRIPRPATVLVHGGEAEVVQRREQPEELLRYDLLPPHLHPIP
jgi:diaminopimelate decarboxylase